MSRFLYAKIFIIIFYQLFICNHNILKKSNFINIYIIFLNFFRGFSSFAPISMSSKKKGIIKNKFTPEEDQQLIKLVNESEFLDWAAIAEKMKTKSMRQCHDRWNYYLNPCLSREPYSPEEDELLLDLYYEQGPKWKKIADFFQKRSEVSLRNRCQVLIRGIEKAERKKQLTDNDSNRDIQYIYDRVDSMTGFFDRDDVYHKRTAEVQPSFAKEAGAASDICGGASQTNPMVTFDELFCLDFTNFEKLTSNMS